MTRVSSLETNTSIKQESRREAPIPDEFVVKLAIYVLPQLPASKIRDAVLATSREGTSPRRDGSVTKTREIVDDSALELISEIDLIIATWLLDSPADSCPPKLLEKLPDCDALRLSELVLEEIIVTIRKLLQELVIFKFVMSPENVKEYVASANLDTAAVEILMSAYQVCLQPENEPLGLEDYPAFQNYLQIIESEVMERTRGLDLETAENLIPHLPSPLSSRCKQKPVPPRILEMISQRLWPVWQGQAAKSLRLLSAHWAFTLIYSLYNRFSERKRNDEDTVVQKALIKLGFETDLMDEMLQERRVTKKCYKTFHEKYGRMRNIMVPALDISGRSSIKSCTGSNISFAAACFNRIQISSNYHLMMAFDEGNGCVEKFFDQSICQRSYQFVSEFIDSVLHVPIKLANTVLYYLEKSRSQRDIELLDLTIRNSKGYERRPYTLISRLMTNFVPPECLKMIELSAPMTWASILRSFSEDLPELSNQLYFNTFHSLSLFQVIYSRESIKVIFARFAEKPSLERLEWIDKLYDISIGSTSLVNRECFFQVAEVIIKNGLTDLVGPGSSYIKAFCSTYPAIAEARMYEYVKSHTYQSDLDTDFIAKCRPFFR